jgi:ribonucleoside-triphosphate reductase (formate)
MSGTKETPARSYAPGIGDAVANRTINRRVKESFTKPQRITKIFPRRDDVALDQVIASWAKSSGWDVDSWTVKHGNDIDVTVEIISSARERYENWAEVAKRVAYGNSLLAPNPADRDAEFNRANHHLRQASILMSGRHLQHGDETQPSRNIEVYTNCSTSAASFVTFYLLLNGSGVGRCYDDQMMVVNWSKMPVVVPVIRQDHPDVMSGEIQALSIAEAKHMYAYADIIEYKVPDSREGWAHAVEVIEVATFEGDNDSVILLDFSDVRERGKPIGGMQNRPASGPGPMMTALRKVAQLRGSNMAPWRSTMFVDHYLAECVLVGGARRAARMSTKSWRDPSVLDFVSVKRGGFLWSSNNSVTVDQEFWDLVRSYMESEAVSDEAQRAYDIYEAICSASYHDGTGEPGLINADKLVSRDGGMAIYDDGIVIHSSRFQPFGHTAELFKALTSRANSSRYNMITNPCGEIALFMLGGYCVIGDVVPFHTSSDDDAEDAFRTMTRMLIRTNLMEALYGKEVARTNRIGVSMTGIHEYAWSRFGYGWKDIVDEKKSEDFWMMLARFKRAVDDEAATYSEELKVCRPHTNTTIKPAGTTSKLFGLSEGAHLPSMREYLRWVQFRTDDPMIADYQSRGYPIRHLKTYSGTTIIGFPTQPKICSLGMGDKLVTAGEATPEEQYEFLRLLEKYWIVGVDKSGKPLEDDTGNQVSYTLKYKPGLVNYERFKETLLNGQSTIRCCSVMPQMDASEYAYEYVPEEAITKHEYEQVLMEIKSDVHDIQEDISFEHVDCSTGACPIDFSDKKAGE